MTNVRRPDKPLDRDKGTLAKNIRFLGALELDPERPGHGTAWVRSDLSPPEFRIRLWDATFSVGLTEV